MFFTTILFKICSESYIGQTILQRGKTAVSFFLLIIRYNFFVSVNRTKQSHILSLQVFWVAEPLALLGVGLISVNKV